MSGAFRSLFSPNVRDTLLLNGYADQVADLYASMDLTRTTDALPVVAAVRISMRRERACVLAVFARTLALGPDPGKVLVDNPGTARWFSLLLTLAMTPLQRVTGGRLARCAETAWTLVLQLCIAASR